MHRQSQGTSPVFRQRSIGLATFGAVSALALLTTMPGAWAQTTPKTAPTLEQARASTKKVYVPVAQRPKRSLRERQARAKAMPLPILKSLPAGTKAAAPPAAPGASAIVAPKSLRVPASARASGNPSQPPLKWAGKLFFNKPDGEYTCSAQFVTPTILLTAAHCVQNAESGDWYEDITFYLQFDRGRRTSEHRALCTLAPNGWTTMPSPDQYPYDMAMIVVDEPSPSGYMGTHYGYDPKAYPRAWTIGYPGGIQSGNVVQELAGKLQVSQFDGVLALSYNEDAQRGGSSGGAWVGKYSRSVGNNNYAISINSFGLGDENTVMYGPYFGEAFHNLLNDAKQGC